MSLSASMTAKRSALATLVKTTLDAFGYATFKVDERVKESIVNAEGQLDGKHIMGDPIAYSRIAHIGNRDEDESHMTAFGAVAQVPHEFLVALWYQYADADTYADSSQKEWDDLIEGDSGLLTTLRDSGILGSNVAYSSPPQEVIVTPEPLHMYEQIYAHFCQFTITLT